MGQAKYQLDGDSRTSGPGFGVTMHADVLSEPLRWRTPRKVFVNSMSDVGHARISRPFVAQTWAVMALARRHTFQVLTKRPKRVAAMLADHVFMRQVGMAATEIIGRTPHGVWHMDMTGWTLEGSIEDRVWMPPWPLPNVWVGTSIESDDYTWRADELRRAPAAVRFLSLEPLLGPLASLDLTSIDWVIVGVGRPPRSWLPRRTVTDGSRPLCHPADGTSGRAPSERLNHRTRRSFPSREQPVRTPIPGGWPAS